MRSGPSHVFGKCGNKFSEFVKAVGIDGCEMHRTPLALMFPVVTQKFDI